MCIRDSHNHCFSGNIKGGITPDCSDAGKQFLKFSHPVQRLCKRILVAEDFLIDRLIRRLYLQLSHLLSV